MKRMIFVMSLLVVGACYSEEPGVAVYGGGYYAGPSMAYVGPGVQVVADYDYPVFYSDGYYWRYGDGVWYRSGFYDRGWAVSYNVPYAVRGISRPEAYAHYRGGYNGGYYNGGYRPNQNWGAPRGGTYNRPSANASGGVYVNDHRSYQPAYRPAPSRPVVRDHRR